MAGAAGAAALALPWRLHVCVLLLWKEPGLLLWLLL
jgi:hypothetical protein